MVTDRYHIYRWMGLYRSTDKMGRFMGRGKIAEYNIPGKWLMYLWFEQFYLQLVS